MIGKLKSILSILAFALALAMAPMSVAFADGDLGLVFDVLDDSDSEEGSIMDLEELKRILKKDKGKIIIVENGKPIMVVLAYENLIEQDSIKEVAEPLLEEEERRPVPGELTIDDLPL